MVIFDVSKGQITNKVTKFIEENNCAIVHVPNNMTDQFQPLDLNVNCHAKEFLNGKFEFWYSEGRKLCLRRSISIETSVIKSTHAKWLLGIYDHLRNSSDTIIKGFTMAGIKDALIMELPLEDPFADLAA